MRFPRPRRPAVSRSYRRRGRPEGVLSFRLLGAVLALLPVGAAAQTDAAIGMGSGPERQRSVDARFEIDGVTHAEIVKLLDRFGLVFDLVNLARVVRRFSALAVRDQVRDDHVVGLDRLPATGLESPAGVLEHERRRRVPNGAVRGRVLVLQLGGRAGGAAG